MHWKTKLYCILLFAVAVAIRLPQLNRPLSKHHEFNMAMVLNVCKSWDIIGGAAAANYCPVIHYGNAADSIYIQSPTVINGKYYYISIGPLQCVLPYYFCKVLGLQFTPLHVAIFSILLFALVCCVWYRLLVLFCKKFNSPNASVLIGMAVFLFLPNMLWFFGNAYNHESLALLFYLVIIHHYYKHYYIQVPITKYSNVALYTAIICGVLTDWFMVVVAAFFMLYLLITNIKKNLVTIACIGFTVLASIATILYCYSQHWQFNNLVQVLFGKFYTRTYGGSVQHYNIQSTLLAWLQHILSSYAFVGIGIISTFIFASTSSKKLVAFKPIILIMLPALFYFVVLSEFSAENDYAVLKFSFGLILALLLLLDTCTKKIQIIITIAICAANIALYYYINKPGNTSYNGDAYNAIKNMGLYIKQTSKLTETIVVNSPVYNYLGVIYYAERNIVFLQNNEEVNEYITTNKLHNVKVYTCVNDSITGSFLIR